MSPRQTQVALIRGINVGRAKRVAMADLREVVGALGYDNVRTLLNSGNVVYTTEDTAAKAAERIEAAIEGACGVAARVFAVPAKDIASIVADNPLLDVMTDPSRFLVAVPAHAAARTRLVALTTRDWSPDAIAVGRHAAYLWCTKGILDSPLSKEVMRTLRDDVTTRNWATMLKLHALAHAAG